MLDPIQAETAELPVIALSTLQFSWGALLNWSPADDGFMVHLVRATKRGTPGPVLCGIDRFAQDGPGWSVGGGISGPAHLLTSLGDEVGAEGDFLLGNPRLLHRGLRIQGNA